MAKKLNITPLHDRVIVKPAAAEEKTAGGIIIPDTAKKKPQRGTVIAAGPGKKDEPVTVKTGDTVLYGKYAGTEIQIEGEDFLIMRESDILAIVYIRYDSMLPHADCSLFQRILSIYHIHKFQNQILWQSKSSSTLKQEIR